MQVLALDVGSSSVKAAILRRRGVVLPVRQVAFPTRYDEQRAEVDPRRLLRAVAQAIAALGPAARRVEMVALSVMSPAWVAMDHAGRAITPIVTHQDRRSVETARELEKRLGKRRWLSIAGNRPFPGGISCTTWAWFLRHAPAAMRRADLCGHLGTFLHRQITHARVIDPSNASFTGFYDTVKQSGWSDELIEAVGIQRHRLPQIIGADGVGGLVTREGASAFGLTHGTPVLPGIIDTSAAMLATGARPGQLLNVCGSTDVLAVCTARARPHEALLTRALGVDGKWMSVSTLAAAGSALTWARRELFAEYAEVKFWRLVDRLARERGEASSVLFQPYLAGERTSIEQKRGALENLTLSTTRIDLLQAIVEGLGRASADRIAVLQSAGVKLRREVVVSGGARALHRVVRRDWPGRWSFREITDATLRGLAELVVWD
jgi:xylulokinase